MTQVSGRPIIGVVPSYLPDEGKFCVRENYTTAIEDADGVPLVLPISRDLHVYETLFPLIDGFLLTGGADISPERYGEQTPDDMPLPSAESLGTVISPSDFIPTPTREEVECLILSYAYQFDVPVLGICRGMQMINVYFGGTLYLDLADQFEEPASDDKDKRKDSGTRHLQQADFDKPTHFVDIVRASKLAEMFHADSLATNSMHHQGVRDLAPLLDAVAYGPDGLIEGVEVRDRTFIVGVQWHPEYFAGKKHMGCIFRSLIHEAQQTMRRVRTAQPVTMAAHCSLMPCTQFFDLPLRLYIE